MLGALLACKESPPDPPPVVGMTPEQVMTHEPFDESPITVTGVAARIGEDNRTLFFGNGLKAAMGAYECMRGTCYYDAPMAGWTVTLECKGVTLNETRRLWDCARPGERTP